MSEVDNPADGASDEPIPPRPRLRLDLDLVPEQTSDDLATTWGDAPLDDSAKRQSYLAEKPPHHGD
jgi:hypothetical protein